MLVLIDFIIELYMGKPYIYISVSLSLFMSAVHMKRYACC
jgi:hypothetical protein